MVVAGIVTYEPDLSRFEENLLSIAPQVDAVIVFDNGSTKSDDIKRLAHLAGAEFIANGHNEGIAFALNRLADRAQALNARWILTLDQDSVAPNDMVAALIHASQSERLPRRLAIVTPRIVDRNKVDPGDAAGDKEIAGIRVFKQAARKGAITSGALTRLSALAEVGGFDERFFIDYVDYDLNRRLMINGFTIAQCDETHLLHEVGRARPTWLLVPRKSMDGKWGIERFFSFGHSPTRCYYKARNRVYYTRKYWRSGLFQNEGVWQIPQQVALTLLFERDRWHKLKEYARGVRDGICASL